MKRTLVVTMALAALAVALNAPAAAQDGAGQPAWKLTFAHKPLDVITVHYRDGSARSFYYMRFTVRNKSGVTAQLMLHIKADVGTNPRKRKVHVALPEPDAEEAIRRLAGKPGLKNVQDINRMKELANGATVEGVAVFGTFHREWDLATITVSGLESAALRCRVRKFGDVGFTIAHGAYARHNREVMRKAGKGAEYTEVNAIVRHNVLWVMKYRREGDEFAPQLDPIILVEENWDVQSKPGPEIVLEIGAVFGK